jgi:polar amino acid transport system permease protein
VNESLNFAALVPLWSVLAKGLLITSGLTLITTSIGIMLGIGFAALRSGTPRTASLVCGIFVEIVRNTPFVVQLFFVVFALPAVAIKLSAGQAAIIAMSINLAAYSSEIIRAGIIATAKGQHEAGRVLGLNRRQIFLHIILPPAMQRVYPALVSQCIIVMLGSSVVSQVAVEDLTYAANLIQSQTFLSFEIYLVTAVLYLALSLLLRQGSLLLGRKWLRIDCLC